MAQRFCCVENRPLRRCDTIRKDHPYVIDEKFLQGYVQALVDIHFDELCVNVRVQGCTVYLSNVPLDRQLRRALIKFVRDFPFVRKVCVESYSGIINAQERSMARHCCCSDGIWFPQSTELFPTLVADPRQPMFSGSYRFDDRILGSRIGQAAYGDDFPIYRWLNICLFGVLGDLQVGTQAGVWAVFKFADDRIKRETGDTVALMNTDFWVGLPIAFASGCWAFRLRGYHESSHLGDEFLVATPGIIRVNPSREAIDFFVAYFLGDAIMLFGGVGNNIRSDPSFHIAPWYVEYGFELRILGRRMRQQCLYFQPFLATYFRNWQDWQWRFDATYRLGWEWSKLQGIGRKNRTYIEWHDGYSLDGQFSKFRTWFFAIATSWGF